MKYTKTLNRSLAVILGVLTFGSASLAAKPLNAPQPSVRSEPEAEDFSAHTPIMSLPVELPSDITPEDILRATQGCVHETTWAGGRTTDCGGIVQVIQNSRRPGESFSSAISRRMPRFFGHSTRRTWVLYLQPGPIQTNPEGWPYDVPMSEFSSEWNSVYTRTREYMTGAKSLPCRKQPIRWFGRVTDADRLAAALASGDWVDAECGNSRNMFLAPRYTRH